MRGRGDAPQEAIHPPPDIDDPLPPDPHAIPLTGAPWPTSSATGCPGLRISSMSTLDSSIPKHASMCLCVSSDDCDGDLEIDQGNDGADKKQGFRKIDILFTITKRYPSQRSICRGLV